MDLKSCDFFSKFCEGNDLSVSFDGYVTTDDMEAKTYSVAQLKTILCNRWVGNAHIRQ